MRQRDNSEIERNLKEEAERVEDEERGKWREKVFNYSALPMFSIYGPFKPSSRSYIYAHTVGTLSSLK